jgi:hypothetical protein
VILLYPVVLVAAVVMMRRAEGKNAQDGARWFGWWTAAGGLFTFSLLTGFSIGLFVLPLATALLLWVARRAPGREAIGFVEGVGIVLITVWFLNRDYTPCPPNGRLSIPASAPPGTSVSCGGFDARPWLAAGVLVSSLAFAAYAVARRRS